MTGDARTARTSLLSAAGAYFCLLAGYYMLRSLREAMALEAGRALIPTLFTITFVVMLGILPLYWAAVARLSRAWLVPCIYGLVIVTFSALAIGFATSADIRLLAAVYFVAVTSLNLFMVSVFWSVMADRWSPEESKRLFGFIAAGGSLGALAGPAINATFVHALGPTWVIVCACLLIGVAIVLANIARRDIGKRDVSRLIATPEAAVGGSAVDDLRRLVQSPYLLGIAALIVVGQILGAFFYNEQARYVEAAYTTLADRAALFARIDFTVNVIALVLQTFVVGWLTKWGGVRASLTAMPIVVGLSFIALGAVPTLAMLLATQIIRRAADYGLAKPSREMLFTVLNPESKFKSKSLIDTVLQRGADSVGNWLYVLVAGLGLAGLSWLGAAVCAALIGLTFRLAQRFDSR